MKTLSLDQGITTGWAVNTERGNILHGTNTVKHRPNTCGLAVSEFDRWLNAMLFRLCPDSVIVEEPFFRGDSSLLLYGFVIVAEKVCHERKVKLLFAKPSTVRKCVLGKGNYPTDKILPAVRRAGYQVANEHEADAVVQLLWNKGMVIRP